MVLHGKTWMIDCSPKLQYTTITCGRILNIRLFWGTLTMIFRVGHKHLFFFRSPSLHNNIQIHNNVMCGCQYSIKYIKDVPTFTLNVGISWFALWNIVSPINLFMNMNNTTHITTNSFLFVFILFYDNSYPMCSVVIVVQCMTYIMNINHKGVIKLSKSLYCIKKIVWTISHLSESGLFYCRWCRSGVGILVTIQALLQSALFGCPCTLDVLLECEDIMGYLRRTKSCVGLGCRELWPIFIENLETISLTTFVRRGFLLICFLTHET